MGGNSHYERLVPIAVQSAVAVHHRVPDQLPSRKDTDPSMSLKFDPNHNRHYRASHFTEEDSYRMSDLLPGKLPSWSWERWFFVGSASGSISVGVFLGFWYRDWKAILPGVGMALLSTLLAIMIDWDSE